MVQLVDHFERDSGSRHSEWLRQREWFIKAKTNKINREEFENQAEETQLTTAVVIVVATEAQIKAFEAKLDAYDEAAVRALDQNRISMDEVKERLVDVDLYLQQLLAQAYVMEDGRRVFLTQDRTQAFDEDGVEVSPDELDFNLIGPDQPTWESFQAGKNDRDAIQAELDRLEAERQEIIDFQDKIDVARQVISEGDIPTGQLDALDAEFSEAMPPSVRVHVPGFDTAENSPNLKTNFTIPTIPLSVLKRDAAITAEPAPDFENLG